MMDSDKATWTVDSMELLSELKKVVVSEKWMVDN